MHAPWGSKINNYILTSCTISTVVSQIQWTVLSLHLESGRLSLLFCNLSTESLRITQTGLFKMFEVKAISLAVEVDRIFLKMPF